MLESLTVDMIIVPTAPRGTPDGWIQKTDLNLGRILAGLKLQQQFGAPMLISGYTEEMRVVRKEVRTVLRKYGLAKPRITYCDQARYTTGNSICGLRAARRRFGFDSLRSPKPERTLVFCTNGEHAERLETSTIAIQALLHEVNLVWARAKPFKIAVVKVNAEGVDPAFVESVMANEKQKLAEDLKRIRRWHQRIIFDAPTGIQNSLFSYLHDGPNDAADMEFARGIVETENDAPNPYPILSYIERQVTSA